MAYRLLCRVLVLLVVVSWPLEAYAWGKGHRLIRLWAVARLPQWQRHLVGQQSLDRLCKEYTSLQDRHAGGNAPELDPYCIVPGVRLSLHDVSPPAPSAKGILWYLDRIAENLDAEKTDEAMKFLGVLCHWNEDPGCPGAHSSPVSEVQLKTLLPPPKDKARFNYLYGAGGIMDIGDYRIANVEYQPRLLGRTREEAALRIYQHQRLLRQHAGTHIIPIVQDTMYGDGKKADQHRSTAALVNARHTADVIYTALCLASGRFDNGQDVISKQPLSDWLPEFRGRMIPHPYYVTPFLLNQAMDAKRQLHPLAFNGDSKVKIRSGYGIGTPFSLDFVLAPGRVFNRFTCRVGLHPTAGSNGGVVFVVTANGKELTRTSTLKSGAAPVTIDVALPATDALELSLKTVAARGSNAAHNLTVWADPELHLR